MTANSITKTNGNGTNNASAPATDIMAYAGDMTREQVQLIKTAVITGGARPVTDNELALFLTVCARRGLDPFSGQVYGIMRSTREKSGQWVEKLVIQVGIDGYRLLAEKTGKYEGLAGPFWCGADGQWVDVWLSDKPPAAAKVGVYRAGCRDPFWGVCTYREYVQTRDGKPVGKWADMPANQLAKCCEAAAIRKAFPQAVGGVTTPEMAGADTESYEITEGERETARLVDSRKAEQEARGRTAWREELDDVIEGAARPVPATEPARPASASQAPPDVVMEAIGAAATVAALEAVQKREDWQGEIHQGAFDARTVELVSAALDGLDWSKPAAVESRLKVAAIKLDRLPMDTPGASLALDKLEAARQQLASITALAAAD